MLLAANYESRAVVKRNLTELRNFLHEASKPHAFGNSNAQRMPDNSVAITFDKDEWSFHDNFFGGQPYGGRTVISYKQKPIWMMVYYGQVHDTILNTHDIYTFLRTALQHAPKKKPYRGPDHFKEGDLEYRNSVSGNIQNYSGREAILENNQEIFWTSYLGGLIDQEKGTGF
jgi:hypothetical protein